MLRPSVELTVHTGRSANILNEGYVRKGRVNPKTSVKDTASSPGVSNVPLPSALPLFGTGLAIMGFVGWRRKRKTAATA